MLRKLLGRRPKKIVIYTQPTRADCHTAKRFFAEKGIEFVDKDVTIDEKAMAELTQTIGRFATPTIVVGDEVLLGFAANRARIQVLVAELSADGSSG